MAGVYFAEWTGAYSGRKLRNERCAPQLTLRERDQHGQRKVDVMQEGSRNMVSMIGERIREARLAQDRSLADVAAKAQISVATLSRIETDKQSLDLGLFLSIAQDLQISAQQLIGDDSGHNGDPLARRLAAVGPRE